MKNESPAELVALVEQSFDNAEEAIAAFEAGLAAEERLTDWPLADDRRFVRCKLLIRLGEAHEQLRQGSRADNVEKALSTLELANRTPSLKDSPELWAGLQHKIGRMYLLRVRGDRADNLEQAIAFSDIALQVRTLEGLPLDWVRTQHNLAVIFANRIRGDRADNLERAIAYSEATLQVRTRTAFPADWAMTQNTLGLLYSDRIRGDRADNLERAIAIHEEALQVRTREAFPADWAMTHNNLAKAYSDRIRGDKADNLERSIELYLATLEVYTREARPYDWAMTQQNLANVYERRIRGDRADNQERAIAIFEAALTVRTREAFPFEWAMTQNNLAGAYWGRFRGEKANNLERAITLFEATREVYTREAFPHDWARVQNNLALAYSYRIRGEKADNLEQAIALYESALQVRTRESLPYEWADTQNNLAITYLDRVRGNRAENLERAIALNDAAMSVRTREAFPKAWADTQQNLANVYLVRVFGEATDNLKRAIGLQEAALTVLTRDAFPHDHLRTIRRLGETLLRLRRWPEASAACVEARETFQMLLGEGLEETEARGLVETAGPLFACASYAAAETRENERAFALACEGKARLMAMALRLQQLDLPTEQAIRLGTLRTDIREQSRRLEIAGGLDRADVLDRLAELRSELAGLIALGEERTGRRDAMAQVRNICADGSVIVIPVVTEVGGKLLLAHGSTVSTADLPHLTIDRVKLLMRGDAESVQPGWLDSFARDTAGQERKRRTLSAVDNVGTTLWTLLAGPLEAALAMLGVEPDARLIFMPSGGVGLLPLGLAENPDTGRRLIETREIVYAPSLEAIDRTKIATAAPSLAAIINPTGDLIYAPIEGDLVKANFKDHATLDGGSASPAAVLNSLKGKSHWHFATHGIFDLNEARRSALAMKDGTTLSVGDLLEAEDLGRPRLVVLSACETGLHDIDHTPEEFVGFPGAFMTMGAQAVLGTLWPVDDCAAALLTSRFYDGHLGENLAPASALRQAQLWLAGATRHELAAYAQSAAANGHLNAGALLQLETAIEGAAAEYVRFFDMPAAVKLEGSLPTTNEGGKPQRPFAHPIYWGGFVVTGQ